MKRVLALVAVLLAVASVAAGRRPPGRAASGDGPSRAVKAAAKRHFAVAEKEFAKGRYAEAMVAYKAAWETWPLDGFLFNIAQCHRNLGQVEEAIEAFDTYLASPHVRNRAEVEAVVAELRRKRAAIVAPAPKPVEEPAPPPAPAFRDPFAPPVPATKSEVASVETPKTEAAKAAPPPAAVIVPPPPAAVIAPPAVVEAAPAAVAATPAPGAPAPLYRSPWFWVSAASALVIVGGGVTAAAFASPHPPAGSLGTLDWR